MKTPVTATFLLQVASLAVALATSPSAELQPEELDSNGTMLITARDTKEEEAWHGEGAALCGIYANAHFGKINDFAYDLDNGDYYKEWTIGPGKCNRVKCWDTSALYVCNDNKEAITLKGKQIGMATKWIRKRCCMAVRSTAFDIQLSGQQFTPWGWNVNAAYGNCNDSPEIRPHLAGGWGVNEGKCLYQQQWVQF